MKNWVLLLAMLVFLDCADKNQLSPEKMNKIQASNSSIVDYKIRNLDNFRKIRSEMTNDEVFDLVGRPDRDIGSGLFIYEYILQDSSIVMVGTTGKNVLYVRHNNSNLLADAG